jgi:hypothetical protein
VRNTEERTDTRTRGDPSNSRETPQQYRSTMREIVRELHPNMVNADRIVSRKIETCDMVLSTFVYI